MQRIIWILIALLLVFHQDNWFWADPRLVFGFIPVGLFYHACLSIAAASVWWLAVRYAWPSNIGPSNIGPNHQELRKQDSQFSSAQTPTSSTTPDC